MMDDIELSLMDQKNDLEMKEGKLDDLVKSLLSPLEKEYSLSLAQWSDGVLQTGAMRENRAYQPGSVGKIAVGIAIFHELNEIYNGDWEQIRAVLYTKKVRAGSWALPNHHTVPFYNLKEKKYYKRHVREDDVFSLYEWLDHMFSKSSNAAASVLWREAVIMHLADQQYECINDDEGEEMIMQADRRIMSDIAIDRVNCPLREIGIGHNEWRLGSFFTGGADRKIQGKGGSTGTTEGLMKFCLALEKGEVINPRISLEIKRLMYITDRRIRYAASSSIKKDAVYFKSGSFYSFYDEPGFERRSYAGNRFNYMNSVAIVEKLDDCEKMVYITVLMSNVLRKNSVNEHYGLAARIDRALCSE